MNRRQTKQTTREILREIMEPWDPQGIFPRLSLFTDIFVLVCILASCGLVDLEHLYPLEDYPRLHQFFWSKRSRLPRSTR